MIRVIEYQPVAQKQSKKPECLSKTKQNSNQGRDNHEANQ
jgi:hypothetical protein